MQPSSHSRYPENNLVSLIRFRGYLPKGGHDRQNGIQQTGRRVRRQFTAHVVNAQPETEMIV
jgi:hypothetical protein